MLPLNSQPVQPEILNAAVHLFTGAKATTPKKTLTLAETLTRIKNGTYRAKVQRLQAIRATEGRMSYKLAKERLDAVTFCGTFHPTRKIVSLQKHSGIVHGDIDHLDDVQAAKARLCADPHTVYCFISPSGAGLKVGLHVAIVTDDAAYKVAWQAAADYQHTQYGIHWDISGKDISRLCFLSDDPDVYINPHATCFPVPEVAPALPALYRMPLVATLDDTTLLDKAMHAKDRAKFAALWAGDATGYASQSEADEALCCLLVWWTQHEQARVDQLFRQSALYTTIDRHANPEDYLTRTITRAMEYVRTDYDPRVHRNGSTHPARIIPHMSGALPAAVQGNGQVHEGTEDLDTRIDGPAQPTAHNPDVLPWSDYKNALAVVADHGEDVRYCFPWKKWLTWSGTHWHADDTGKVMRHAKATIKRLARHIEDMDDDNKIAAYQRHIKKSLSTASLKAMLESAQSEESIPILPEALDRDPWVLNCANGTVDLHTGTRMGHARADLLTKCIPVAYDKEAACPTWDAFLWRIMGGTVTPDDPNMTTGELDACTEADDRAQRLIAFLQRAIGYSLTGNTSEQCLFVLHGSGANGKSTLLELLQALLGDYAQSTPSASLLAKERYDGIPNDIARLRGARLVTAVEIGEGKRLNEELVKRLTGQDTMTARFLHAEFFDFRPQFKLFLACNHLPQIRGTDHAIWRRVKLIPFTVTIPAKDQKKDLLKQLKAELPGILAWAVRGCLLWQEDGLGTPEEVTVATEDYRKSQDALGKFLEHCCKTGDVAYVKIRTTNLYEAYSNWAGGSALSADNFMKRLDERGYTRQRGTGNQYYWHGLTLL